MQVAIWFLVGGGVDFSDTTGTVTDHISLRPENIKVDIISYFWVLTFLEINCDASVTVSSPCSVSANTKGLKFEGLKKWGLGNLILYYVDTSVIAFSCTYDGLVASLSVSKSAPKVVSW